MNIFTQSGLLFLMLASHGLFCIPIEIAETAGLNTLITNMGTLRGWQEVFPSGQAGECRSGQIKYSEFDFFAVTSHKPLPVVLMVELLLFVARNPDRLREMVTSSTVIIFDVIRRRFGLQNLDALADFLSQRHIVKLLSLKGVFFQDLNKLAEPARDYAVRAMFWGVYACVEQELGCSRQLDDYKIHCPLVRHYIKSGRVDERFCSLDHLFKAIVIRDLRIAFELLRKTNRRFYLDQMDTYWPESNAAICDCVEKMQRTVEHTLVAIEVENWPDEASD